MSSIYLYEGCAVIADDLSAAPYDGFVMLDVLPIEFDTCFHDNT